MCNNVGGREKMLLRQWMTEAGTGLELEFIQKFTDQTLTSTGELSSLQILKIFILCSADDDPWYSALTRAFTKHQLKVIDDFVSFVS